MPQIKKILVTGGAGFIGSHLVDKLSEDKNNAIIVFDNFKRGRIENIKRHLNNKRVHVVKGDVRDYPSLKKMGAVDELYHLAAQSNVIGSFHEPDYSFGSNVIGTYNVLKYASAFNVKRLLFSSSREVYGNPEYLPVDEKHPLSPINMYGSTKAAGEMLCRAFMRNRAMNITIARMANAYGPRDKDRVIPIFIERAKHNHNLELFGGKQVLDFIWIGDMIKAMSIIMEEDAYRGETVNIGTGKGTSIENLAKKIITLLHSRSKIVRREARSFDVSHFVAACRLPLETLDLNDGLKMMLAK